ncbi:MAG: hypothetical protein HYW27_02945 [Candidatus Aenigmarchaeota archaeon]|nr:hypothetical protein [Candidatus Aenigmarchaeota archaeon]
MKIFYVSDTPHGEFFYDPKTYTAVSISDDGPLVIGMEEGYLPTDMPGCTEYEIPDDLFDDLKDVALRYSKASRDLGRVLRRFPRTKSPSRPEEHHYCLQED